MSSHSPKPFPYSSSIPIFPPSFHFLSFFLLSSHPLYSTLLYSTPFHFTPFSYSTPLHTTYHPSLPKPTPLLFQLHFTSLQFPSLIGLYHSSFSLLFPFTILLSIPLFSPPLPFSLSVCVCVCLCLCFSRFLSFSQLSHSPFYLLLLLLSSPPHLPISLLLSLLPPFLIHHHLLLLLVLLLLAHPPHPYFTLLLMCLSLPRYSLLSSILFLVRFRSSWYLLLLV